MADAVLPRLLYLADVPVESSQHGSALLYRALEQYPADRLRIIETGEVSVPARRLRQVAYAHLPIGRRRWLDTRLHGVYSAWLSWRAAGRAGRAVASLSGFDVDAVLTVGHGFGWLTAAAVAERLNVPLHMIVHDDWPRASAIAAPFRPWLDRAFGNVYRRAGSRLVVSPFMAEEYQRRYGADGSLMYPSRSHDCPVFAARPARQIAGGEMAIGYGGNAGAAMVECLRGLARAIHGTPARLVLFGGFSEHAQQLLRAESAAISFRGLVPYADMIRGLREAADVLYVPMSFASSQRANTSILFPSKLTDYTATGLPLLIHGPSYASAVRWAHIESGVAEVVDEPGETPLRAALERLREDAGRRDRLAAMAVATGQRCFNYIHAQHALYAALTRTGS
jgi:hypothetical protein